MAFPKSVPSLDSEEFATFREELEEYELSDEMEDRVQAHMKLLEEDDS